MEVAHDRAFDEKYMVLPVEVARGTYMQNPPGLAALKLMHALIGKAGGRMGEDVEHRVRLSEVRAIEGLRHHDRASLSSLFAELQAAVLISDDTARQRLTIGGLLDIAEVDYRDETSGDLVISWYFSRMFTRMAAASDHWAIIDRQTAFRLRSRYSMLLFQHISSFVKMEHITRKIFSVPELRAILGVETGKLDRFADLNARAIQPAIEEISAESRFVLTATTRKIGRTVATVEIAWDEKPSEERKAVKAEQDRHSTGRKARRDGAAEMTVRAFPASGSITYTPWSDVARQELPQPRRDLDLVAERFRVWCDTKQIPLNAPNIEAIFRKFCQREKPAR